MIFAELSVVIPCFNCSSTIERAIASILNQSVLPNQIIAINDCSSDNTEHLLSMIDIPDGIDYKIINLNENAGPAHARNIGIDKANNNLIAFLDSDDTWHPRKIEIQYRLMYQNPEIALSGHRVSLMAEGGNDFLYDEAKLKKISFKKLIFKNYFNTPSVMIRKSELRFPESLKYAEDFYFWLSISNKGGNMIYIDSTLAFVHKPFYGHSGLSQSLKKMHISEIFVLSSFVENRQSGRIIVGLAIKFARLKYLVRKFRVLISAI